MKTLDGALHATDEPAMLAELLSPAAGATPRRVVLTAIPGTRTVPRHCACSCGVRCVVVRVRCVAACGGGARAVCKIVPLGSGCCCVP